MTLTSSRASGRSQPHVNNAALYSGTDVGPGTNRQSRLIKSSVPLVSGLLITARQGMLRLEELFSNNTVKTF